MPASTLASTIGAIAGLVTACAVVITAIAGLIAAKRLNNKVDAVHVLVNQRYTDIVNYQRALIAALKKAGVEVPDDQSATDVAG